MKFLEINIGEKILLDIGLGIDYFGSDSRSMGNESQNKQSGLHQTESFCTGKEVMNKMKKTACGWEKTFANHLPEKGFISKYIQRPYHSIAKKKQSDLFL